MTSNRLLIPISREHVPQVKERYPFLYLEHGRLAVDDSSVKWINSDGDVIHIPAAMVLTLLLGPGTSITHEVFKVLGAANVTVCWVGVDSMLYYALGKSPTADTRNLRRQAYISTHPDLALVVARRMFKNRFPKENVDEKSLHELMGMEGIRVRASYERMAEKYGVGWQGRSYVPGHFEMGTVTNQILTSCNTALYSILLSAVHALGYSPYLGFVHSGSPLPFIYDLADLFKERVSIDLAFSLTLELAGKYDRYRVADAFRRRIEEEKILENIGQTISDLFKGISDGRSVRN